MPNKQDHSNEILWVCPLLEDAGLKVGGIQTVTGSVWAAGRVTAQEPERDTIADK